jgi:hypothetical protein
VRSGAAQAPRNTGHGRGETRTVTAVTVHLPGGLGFPYAQEAVRITRTRTIKAKTSHETAYLVVSLPDICANRPTYGTGLAANGTSRTGRTGSAIWPCVKTLTESEPVIALPPSPCCATPLPAFTAATARPTSPAPLTARAGAQRAHRRCNYEAYDNAMTLPWHEANRPGSAPPEEHHEPASLDQHGLLTPSPVPKKRTRVALCLQKDQRWETVIGD